MKLESIILSDFFDLLNKNSINYCVMNNYTEMPEVIPTDVDFAIELKDYEKLDSLVEYISKKYKIEITQKIWHGFNKCAYILSPIEIKSYFWLQLDFFVDFSGKGFPNLLPINEMLSSKRKYKNFYIPSEEIEVPFVIQRRIFKGDLKQRHIDIIKTLYLKDELNIDKKMENIFGKKAFKILKNVVFNNDKELFEREYSYLRKVLKEVSNKNTNIRYRSRYIFSQLIRTIYRIYYPNSLSVNLIGKNKDELVKLSENIDAIISGSFHGTSTTKTQSMFSYLKVYLKKILIPKITKRKVFIISHVDFNNSLFLKIFKMNPDISIFYDESFDMNKTINKIMEIQSSKTKKHLYSFLSPTSKNKMRDINE